MQRFIFFALIATFVFCGEAQAQRGKFLKRLRADIFGSQPQPPQTRPPVQQQRTPTLAKPNTARQTPQQNPYLRQQQQRTPTTTNRYPQQQTRGTTRYPQPPSSTAGRYAPTKQQLPTSATSRTQQRSLKPTPTLNRGAERKSAIATRTGFGLRLDTNRNDELYVASVVPGGNAAKAGIRRGDTILEIGGVEATSVEEYDQISKAMSEGDQMEFRIERHGQTDKMLVAWGEAPDLENLETTTDLGPAPRKNSDGKERNYDFVPPAGGGKSVLDGSSVRGKPVSSSNQVQQLSRTVQQQNQTIRQLQGELSKLRGAMGNGRR